MKRMFFLFSLGLAVIILSTTYASAGSVIKDLKGEYATIGTRSCVQADLNGDFGSGPWYRLLSNGSSLIYQEAGVLTLYGDGNGLLNGTHFLINNSSVTANAFPIMVFAVECDVKYKDLPDGTIEFRYTNCNGPITAGYFTGSIAGVYTESVSSAILSVDKNTLVGSDLAPNVETTWLTTGGVTTTYKRICSRTGTAIRKPREGHK